MDDNPPRSRGADNEVLPYVGSVEACASNRVTVAARPIDVITVDCQRMRAVESLDKALSDVGSIEFRSADGGARAAIFSAGVRPVQVIAMDHNAYRPLCLGDETLVHLRPIDE